MYMSWFGTTGVSGDGICRKTEQNSQGYPWIVYNLGAVLVIFSSHDRVPAGPCEARARH